MPEPTSIEELRVAALRKARMGMPRRVLLAAAPLAADEAAEGREDFAPGEAYALGQKESGDVLKEARGDLRGVGPSREVRERHEMREHETRRDLSELGMRPMSHVPHGIRTLPTKTSVKTPEQRQAYMRLRAAELQQRLKTHVKGSGAKATAAAAVQAFGIIKQNNFFYALAFAGALIDDIVDLGTAGFPTLDFVIGLLLLTLVYPYIKNPTVRLSVILVSLMEFIPFVGALPFWSIATLYAWHKWRREEAQERARRERQELPELAEAA